MINSTKNILALLNVLPVLGVGWGAVSAGIKNSAVSTLTLTEIENGTLSDKPLDLALMVLDAGTTVAAVFTQNAFCAAPVTIAKENLLKLTVPPSVEPVYCLVNAGNANAGTGDEGYIAAQKSCSLLAEVTGCDSAQVLPFSTGVIGELLPVSCFEKSMSALYRDVSADGWDRAANAIMTTDTVPKAGSRTMIIDGSTVTLSAICKGAGMIRPNMATMLAYVATDAKICTADADKLLNGAVKKSFNRITVDGDTSTNDACLFAATGQSGVELSPAHSRWDDFKDELNFLFESMATAIIRDAEGATKFITIDVNGGMDSEECLQVAYAVAESPLVKTAFFASDANWGRILAAVGRSGLASLDVKMISIYLDDLLICENGGRAKSYVDSEGMKIMSQAEIKITINLNRGGVSERVWTSDLSLDYVHINADYRS